VGIGHIHVQKVSVREQAVIIADRMRRQRTSTFRALIADCETTMLIVGRFLALLELYRDAMVAFEQITPLGDLTIRWTGPDEGEITVVDEFEGTTVAEPSASDESATLNEAGRDDDEANDFPDDQDPTHDENDHPGSADE
jgi:segregation and condensation protein A